MTQITPYSPFTGRHTPQKRSSKLDAFNRPSSERPPTAPAPQTEETVAFHKRRANEAAMADTIDPQPSPAR